MNTQTSETATTDATPVQQLPVQGLEHAQPPPVPSDVVHVQPTAAPLARPYPAGGQLVPQRTDGFAIASAVCGITGIVPFITQLAGLGCGILSLVRIHRARRRGMPVRGIGWAITGIASSSFVLICWLGVIVGMALVSSTFAGTAGSLQQALNNMP